MIETALRVACCLSIIAEAVRQTQETKPYLPGMMTIGDG